MDLSRASDLPVAGENRFPHQEDRLRLEVDALRAAVSTGGLSGGAFRFFENSFGSKVALTNLTS